MNSDTYVCMWRINGQWNVEFFNNHASAVYKKDNVESAARECGVKIEVMVIAKEETSDVEAQ